MSQLFKFSLAAVLLLTSLVALGQAVTPNIGLYIPGHNYQQWDVPLNTNFTLLDLILSGKEEIPGLWPDWVLFQPKTFSGTSCNANAAGKVRTISDSTTDTDGAVITSGLGPYQVLAFCNGTNWIVISGGPGSGGGCDVTPFADYSLIYTAIEPDKHCQGDIGLTWQPEASNQFHLTVGELSVPTQGDVTIYGYLTLNSEAAGETQSACSSANVGTFWYHAAGHSAADTLQICMKNASDAYVWETVTVTP